MTVLLEDEGFSVVTAETAEQALDQLESIETAVILVDVQLPGISGFELISKIRHNGRAQPCIIVVTSYAMEADRQAAMANGADAYLSKPIDTRTFATAVRRFIDQRQRLTHQMSTG